MMQRQTKMSDWALAVGIVCGLHDGEGPAACALPLTMIGEILQ